LGFEIAAVSAAHGYGNRDLMHLIHVHLPDDHDRKRLQRRQQEPGLRVALLGRPNVGKSSMINAFIGEKRLIVSSEPGTTRDCVDVILEKNNSRYIFIDSAGVRRRSRIKDSLEHFSILRALKQSKQAQVTILVVDSSQGITFQDKRLIATLERDKTPMVVAVNKIDLIPRKDREQIKKQVQEELRFCAHVPVMFTSSVTHAGLGGLLPLIDKLWSECNKRVSTGELNRALGQIISKQQPPMVRHRRAKFYYITQAETSPPTFVFFMNDHTLVKASYNRYLEKQIRKRFGFSLAPVRLCFRTSQG
jgi:GTP-binding protein